MVNRLPEDHRTWMADPAVLTKSMAVLKAKKTRSLMAHAAEMGKYMLHKLRSIEDNKQLKPSKKMRGIGLLLYTYIHTSKCGIKS